MPTSTLLRQLLLATSLASLAGALGALALGSLGTHALLPMGLGAALLPWVAVAAAEGERSGHPGLSLGPANAVTLLRAAVAAPVAGLALSLLLSPGPLPELQSWAVLALAGVALALDGVDGAVARAMDCASPYGARLDMELDAAFTAVLALLLYRSGGAGAWILLAGALRYGFVAAARLWPWLSAPLPPRQRRRVVCVIQIGSLILALCPWLSPWSAPIAAFGLSTLVASFAIDTLWLFKEAP